MAGVTRLDIRSNNVRQGFGVAPIGDNSARLPWYDHVLRDCMIYLHLELPGYHMNKWELLLKCSYRSSYSINPTFLRCVPGEY